MPLASIMSGQDLIAILIILKVSLYIFIFVNDLKLQIIFAMRQENCSCKVESSDKKQRQLKNSDALESARGDLGS